MDAIKFIKELKRMCNSYGVACRNCPIGEKKQGLTCREFRESNPEFFVMLVKDWSDKNQPITNRKKFIEVFGITFAEAVMNPNWANDEYKEIK